MVISETIGDGVANSLDGQAGQGRLFRLKDFDPGDTLQFTDKDKDQAKEALAMDSSQSATRSDAAGMLLSDMSASILNRIMYPFFKKCNGVTIISPILFLYK